MARYIPLSANRRLIIINHYLVYRLRALTCVSLSLLSRGYASTRGQLFARDTRWEGAPEYFYVPEAWLAGRGIIAFTCIGVSLPLWSFQRKIDRTNFFTQPHPIGSWPPSDRDPVSVILICLFRFFSVPQLLGLLFRR